MGGVPYKSKGCNTCRRRKVKCDETRPKCMRCLKNGHTCTGYERNRVFIHNWTEDTDTLALRPRQEPKNQGQVAEAARPVEVRPDISRFDVTPGVRTQFVANFIELFSPASCIRHGKGVRRFQLQDTFPTFIGNSPVLDKAVTALGSAFLAKRNRDHNLLQYSTGLYGESMQLVHRRIRSGRKCGPEFLFATVIFQLYELINSSPLGFSAWLAHVEGSNALLAGQSRSHTPSVTEHLYWRQLKFVTVCDAVGKRKSAYSYNSFWSNPAAENPWQEPVDDILDSLVECSELLEQVDCVIQFGDPYSQEDINAAEALLNRCSILKDHLDSNFSDMQRKLGTPWSTPHQSPFWSALDPSIPTYLFPDAIEFPALTCAESHLLYWTIFILLYPLIDQLYAFLGRLYDNSSLTLWIVPHIRSESQSPLSTDSLLPVDLLKVAEHYADLICCSAKSLIQPETKSLGVQMLLAPFSQTTQFYHSQLLTEKHKWCQSVFMLFPGLGFGIAPFLKDMIWPQYEAATKKTSAISLVSPGQASSQSGFVETPNE